MNKLFRVAAAVVAMMFPGLAWSQGTGGPSFQNNVIPYCPIPGLVDAQGAPIVAPCGYIYGPLSVQVVTGPSAPVNTLQCPKNPISGKVPPIC